MNPYFSPILAQLLMEGVGRRALSHAAETDAQERAPAYARAPVEDAAAYSRALIDHLGQTGMFG